MKSHKTKALRTFCFDIDGTICLTKNGDYKKSKPIKKAIKFVNQLYKKGHYIYFYTSRFNRVYNFDQKKINTKAYNFTINQLKNWGVNFHSLIMMKPDYDYIIDDKYPGYKLSGWIDYLKSKYVS